MIWAFMSMLLVFCFSGEILRYILLRDEIKINSMEELFDSNLTIINNNDSWIWWQIENEWHWGKPLDKNLEHLKSRAIFVPKDVLNSQVMERFRKFNVFHLSIEGKVWRYVWRQKSGFCFGIEWSSEQKVYEFADRPRIGGSPVLLLTGWLSHQ